MRITSGQSRTRLKAGVDFFLVKGRLGYISQLGYVTALRVYSGLDLRVTTGRNRVAHMLQAKAPGILTTVHVLPGGFGRYGTVDTFITRIRSRYPTGQSFT